MNASLPLARFPLFESRNPDECHEQVLAALGPHKFAIRDSADSFHAAQNLTKLAQSVVTYLEYGVPADVTAAVMEQSYLVLAPLEGHGTLRVGGAELELSCGRGAVIVPERPFSFRTTARTSALMWKVNRSALERHAGALIGQELKSAIEFDPQIRLDVGKGASLLRYLRFFAAELNDGAGAAQSYYVQENMEQMFIRVLLDSQPNQLAKTSDYQGTRIAPKCVRSVERYFAEHLGEDITVEAMIQASGVSGRTMFSAFKSFRGASPMEVLRNTRMRQVRRDLVEAQPSARVTDILTERGITQFGRFAVAYKRRYGESPSQTIKR